MNTEITLELTVPTVLLNIKLNDIDNKTTLRNIRTAWIASRAEEYAVELAEREFAGKKFATATQNQKGFDLKSDCGHIIIEVKHTVGHVWSDKPIIGIGAKNKENSTHFIVFDFHHNRVSLIPTGEIIKGVGLNNKGTQNKHNSFRWDERYLTHDKHAKYQVKGLYKNNTEVFLKYEIEL